MDALIILAALGIGHVAGDYLLQTDRQARSKQDPGWVGYRAMAGHVTTYTAAQAVALAATVPIAPGIGVALVVSAVTHWVIDRGGVLAWLARVTRSSGYHGTPVGRAAQDQAAHWVCLAAAALIGAT